jgi:hypothetical protein
VNHRLVLAIVYLEWRASTYDVKQRKFGKSVIDLGRLDSSCRRGTALFAGWVSFSDGLLEIFVLLLIWICFEFRISSFLGSFSLASCGGVSDGAAMGNNSILLNIQSCHMRKSLSDMKSLSSLRSLE